jgi:sec-independent protein translocase protein TatA
MQRLRRGTVDFFGIGFGEIALILIVALIIFGPGKLPEIARTVGKFTRDVRKMSSDFTSAVNKEIDMAEEAKRKVESEVNQHLPKDLSIDLLATPGPTNPTVQPQNPVSSPEASLQKHE